MSLFWKGQPLTNARLTADYVIHTTTSIVHTALHVIYVLTL